MEMLSEIYLPPAVDHAPDQSRRRPEWHMLGPIPRRHGPLRPLHRCLWVERLQPIKFEIF